MSSWRMWGSWMGDIMSAQPVNHDETIHLVAGPGCNPYLQQDNNPVVPAVFLRLLCRLLATYQDSAMSQRPLMPMIMATLCPTGMVIYLGKSVTVPNGVTVPSGSTSRLLPYDPSRGRKLQKLQCCQLPWTSIYSTFCSMPPQQTSWRRQHVYTREIWYGYLKSPWLRGKFPYLTTMVPVYHRGCVPPYVKFIPQGLTMFFQTLTFTHQLLAGA